MSLSTLHPKRLLPWRLIILAGFFLFVSTALSAQATAPPAYEFLTLTTFESQAKSLSRVLITPAFEGKSEIQLEDFGGFSASKNLDKLQRNTLIVNQQLRALTAAGWELVHVYPVSETGVLTTRYLFRKPK